MTNPRETLKNFINRLDSDDNRATAKPILWCLQRKFVEYYPVWNEGGWWSYPDNEGDFIEAKNLEEAKEIYAKKFDCDSPNDDDFDEWERFERWDTVQTFLTKEGLDRHVAQNKHNLGEYRDYVIPAFRDPELKELYEAIRQVISEDK